MEGTLLAKPPLVLDLDETTTRTDTLVECVLRLLARAPWVLLTLLPLLARGRAAFKQGLTARAGLDPASLVYNHAVLALARQARAEGRTVFLVTGADQGIADAVAAHLGLFDGIYGSDGVRNLKGGNKAAFLCAQFGQGGFDYAGDAYADRPVWRAARRAIVVSPPPGLLRVVRGECADVQLLEARPPFAEQARLVARALRVHQWAKNALLFVPMLAAHRVDGRTLITALAGFVAFSLCASSVYILNDLVDLPHDRLHPTKSRRPFASGALPLLQAPGLLAAMLFGGIAVGCLLPGRFLLMLLGYYVCTLSYSFVLKRRMVVDVMMLAGLYTIRVFAGAAATAIPISPWLLAFSLFLFFCLAVVKRQTELVGAVRSGKAAIAGRGYVPEDLDLLRSMAASSGYMAVLVLALYVNSSDVLSLYPRSWALWLLCPMLLYWVSRVLMLSHRGAMHDDPVIFALKDRISLMTGLLSLGVFAIAAT